MFHLLLTYNTLILIYLPQMPRSSVKDSNAVPPKKMPLLANQAMPMYRNASLNPNDESNAETTMNLVGPPESANENSSSPRKTSMIFPLK